MYRPMFYWPWHWLEVSGQPHASATLAPGKEPPQCPFDRSLNGPQSWSGRNEVKILYPIGTRPLTLRSSKNKTYWVVTRQEKNQIKMLGSH
jgi:hypothetical protein